MIFKVHHSMTDGMGVATLLQVFNGSYDASQLPNFKAPPLWKTMFVYLISPLLVLYTLPIILFQSKNQNDMKKETPMNGNKTLGIIKDMGLLEMKAYCKKIGCTINDYLGAVFNISIHEYLTL